uniref:NADH-ubiquinone oxidoreductase 19 kDa subunit family protein n=1 Tax=Rhizophora mucronata TaxID=61149 RepID=A0A2P2J9T3_RHIMU
MLFQMLAAPCDTNQIHLCSNTCNQRIHPSPLCTFGEDPSTCQQTSQNAEKQKNKIHVCIAHVLICIGTNRFYIVCIL